MTNLARIDKDKRERIEKELEAAGVVHRHMHPFTNNYLPRTIHDEEHIRAAVFGRRKESEGFFGFAEGMLIATDQRILFLDHRPGYTTMDELSYDIVSGVNLSITILNASVTLFTKIANYKISFANHISAQQFADYIENVVTKRENRPIQTEKRAYETVLTDKVSDFLKAHELGLLSAIERTGAVSGVAVHYTMHDGYLYFITKKSSDTILDNQHIAFTVLDEATLQTIQIQGIVEQVHSDAYKTEVFASIMHPQRYATDSDKPSVLTHGPDTTQIYKVVPTKFNFVDLSNQ